MPDIQYGKSAYARSRGSMPDLPVVNMFAEAAPIAKQGTVLQSRKGLSPFETLGSGPIRAIYRQDGVLSGNRITVSGNEVFSGSSLIGAIGGSGPVSVAGDNNEVLIAAGGPLYRWDGSSFSVVAFPDGAPVRKITQLAGYFIAIRGDAAFPQRWYFSSPGDGSSWDGLDYASAESEPDRLLDALVVNDSLVFLGSETVEFWTRTGNADLPFSAIEQRVFKRGAIATGCAVSVDNSFIWVGDDKIVYRGDQVPVAISQDGHSERLNASDTFSVYVVDDERHKFVCIRLDSDTLVYDITTQEWCEFESYGRANFRVLSADSTVMGDDETGTLWVFSGYVDAGVQIERRFRGGFPVDGGSVPMSVVRLRAEVGNTSFLIGSYADPVIEMRLSDDYGRTWSDWEAEPLGTQGDYRTMPEWRALGVADYPGILFEWRVTDPIPFRIADALINEQHGGRQRAA